MRHQQKLLEYYETMLGTLGQSHWWPADSAFEVCIGAILTQNTNWKNVEKALGNLKEAHILSPLRMWQEPVEKMEEHLRPSGFFRMKTQKVQAFLQFLADLAGQENPPDDVNLYFLKDYETTQLRDALLQVRGIGPETADSVLLYALHRPVFVVDAYTHRIFHRHGFVSEDVSYTELQELFSDVLPDDVALYNEFHALIVRTGNAYCKKTKPLCSVCPLAPLLEYEIE